MLRWIAKLLRRGSLEKTCVKTLAKDDLIVRLYACRFKRGEARHLIEVFAHLDDKDGWTKVGVLAAADIPTAIQLLTGVMKHVDAVGTRKFVTALIDD